MPIVAFSIRLDRIEEELLYQDQGAPMVVTRVCAFETDAKKRMVVVQTIPRERYKAGNEAHRWVSGARLAAHQAVAGGKARFRPVQIQGRCHGL